MMHRVALALLVVALEFKGAAFTQRYAGTVEGDAIEGTVEGGRGGAQPFRGSRGD